MPRTEFTPRALANLVTALFALTIVTGVVIVEPGCVRVGVWASFEKSELLSQVATAFEATRPSVDLRCVEVEVYRKASGDAEEALSRGWRAADGPRPDVWSPAANTWVRLLERHRSDAGQPPIVPSNTSVILQSPLVIAMPEPMAAALGWPAKDLGWSDIFALALDPRGWAAFGHPEWERFRLAKTSPQISTSGLHALLATYRAAPAGAIDDSRVRDFVRAVEASVVHYGDTVATFLANLADADDRGEALSYVSAIAMEEKQVWDYNRGNPDFRPAPALPPNIKLVAIHPREGTFVADHPYVTLGESWVDAPKQRGAALFLDYLRSESVQQRFLDSAFRGYGGERGNVLREAKELNATKLVNYFPVPEPAALVRMQNSWKDLRKRARVIVVIDVSSSMGQTVPGSRTKLDLAREAALASLDQFAADDDLALWTFAGGPRQELVPLGRAVDQRPLVKREIDGLAPLGPGKALYASITAGVSALQRGFDRDRINALVVLTDGRNDDPNNDTDVNTLLRLLRGQREDERVRVFTVAFGAGADLATLARIARASHGGSYDARDPQVIERVLRNAVSNF